MIFSIHHQQVIEHLNKTESKYSDFFVDPNTGFLCCIAPFLYTYAILANVHFYGYQKRWCYGSLLEARSAVKDWLEFKTDEPLDYIRKTHL